jgi:hypothetical protein
MKRLSILAAFAALTAATGWAALSPRAAARPDDKPAAATPAGDHHAMYEACAKVCADCMLVCEKTAHHCGELVAAGQKEHAKPAMLAADCAEFCALSAKLTARHSDLCPVACEACAKAADTCAAACEKFPDVPEMKACVESCKKCAASCREMAKMHGHQH